MRAESVRGVRRPEASNECYEHVTVYFQRRLVADIEPSHLLRPIYCCRRGSSVSPFFLFRRIDSVLTAPDSKVVGPPQIAQPFTKDEYFQPRPSAASNDASVSTSSVVSASNNFAFSHQHYRDFGGRLRGSREPIWKGLPFLRLLTIVLHYLPPCAKSVQASQTTSEAFIGMLR